MAARTAAVGGANSRRWRREQGDQVVLKVDATLSIPLDEVVFSASRSSGPGGQNVNKVSTRMTLSFDVGNSPSLSEEQRGTIQRRLANRIDKNGVLALHSQSFRTQQANRQDAIDRFVALLQDALKKRKPRKPTRVSRAAKQRRVEAKRRHSEKKRQRTRTDYDA